MKRPPINFRRQHNTGNKEEGIIIILVAVFLLFVVGAMAALSIDITTFYTARSEAQIAADSAALAAARVLANSGMTSDTTGSLTANAEALATRIATQVAQQDQIGGGQGALQPMGKVCVLAQAVHALGGEKRMGH